MKSPSERNNRGGHSTEFASTTDSHAQSSALRSDASVQKCPRIDRSETFSSYCSATDFYFSRRNCFGLNAFLRQSVVRLPNFNFFSAGAFIGSRIPVVRLAGRRRRRTTRRTDRHRSVNRRRFGESFFFLHRLCYNEARFPTAQFSVKTPPDRSQVTTRVVRTICSAGNATAGNLSYFPQSMGGVWWIALPRRDQRAGAVSHK